MSDDLETAMQAARMFYKLDGWERYWPFEQMPPWLLERYWPAELLVGVATPCA